jgi:hypothetical protein
MPLVLNGTTGVQDNSGAFVAGTAVASTSGTSIDFTSIPSWVKRITFMYDGVSTNGSSNVMLQIGTSSGIETTGYLGAFENTNFAPAGFGITYGTGAGSVAHGIAVITKLNGNSWVYSGAMGYSSSASSGAGGGSKTLSGTLDRVRLTTFTGTDTFDAGSINILYE